VIGSLSLTITSVGQAMRASAARKSMRANSPVEIERQELVMPAVGAAQAQETVRQDAAFEVRVELVFDELRQASTSGRLSLSEEALDVLLHQSVQRSLLGSVALVEHRGAIAMRPAGRAGVGLPGWTRRVWGGAASHDARGGG